MTLYGFHTQKDFSSEEGFVFYFDDKAFFSSKEIATALANGAELFIWEPIA